MKLQAWARVGAMWVLVVLAACGGGGGGGGGEGSESPPVSGPASLIPAPPAPGATLEADATSLLPQVDGAVWTFWGRQRYEAGTERARYETRYILSHIGSEWSLKGSNGGNDGVDEERFAVVGGELQQIESLQFVEGQPAETVRFTLLRSPVRVGDQVTAFSRRLDAIGDLDGDGKSDSLDMAVYVRVVGREDVSLANGEKVSAIRVDTHLVQRPLLSKTNQVGPVDEIVGSDWFAKGVGWVRRQVPVITSSGSLLIGDEQLVSMDAGDTGFGATALQVLVPPVDSPEQAGRPLMTSFPVLQPFGDGVLMVSSHPIVSYPSRQLLTRLDKRGRVLWSRSGPPGMSRFAQLGSGLVAWDPYAYGDDFFIQRLDADGTPMTAAPQRVDMGGDPAVVMGFGGVRLDADAHTLWVAAIRQDRVVLPNGLWGFRDGVVVRGFDTSGQPITEPVLLFQLQDSGLLNTLPSVAAINGSVIVSWAQTVGGEQQLLTAKVDRNGSVLRATPIVGSNGAPAQVLGSPGGALMQWNQGYAWLDDSLNRTGLDGVGTFTNLEPWTGMAGQTGSESRKLSGESILRWGSETSSTLLPASVDDWAVLRLQLIRRAQPAPQRHILLSSDNAGFVEQIVFLGDRALALRGVYTSEGMSWATQVIWF